MMENHSGHDVLLIDDFYGHLPWFTFLALTDIYNVQAPVKSSFVHAQWTKVYITSKANPEVWYRRLNPTKSFKKKG